MDDLFTPVKDNNSYQKQNDNSYKKPYNNNYKKDYNKGSYNKDYKKKKGINLFNEEAEKKKVDTNDIQFNNDVAIVLYDVKDLPDEVKERFRTVFRLMKEAGYNLRVLCVNSNPILKLAEEELGENRINLIKAWDKVCDIKKYRTWKPSDINIQHAAEYTPGFSKVSVGGKYHKAALMTLLLSYTGKNAAKFIFVYDPFYKPNEKVDFTKSKGTSDLYLTVNALKIHSIFNIDNKDDMETIKELLKKQDS